MTRSRLIYLQSIHNPAVIALNGRHCSLNLAMAKWPLKGSDPEAAFCPTRDAYVEPVVQLLKCRSTSRELVL